MSNVAIGVDGVACVSPVPAPRLGPCVPTLPAAPTHPELASVLLPGKQGRPQGVPQTGRILGSRLLDSAGIQKLSDLSESLSPPLQDGGVIGTPG